MPVKNRIQVRRGTTEQWNESTDILSDGEIGFDSSQYNIKIGDGSSTWTELDWLVDLSGQIVSNTGIFDVLEFNTNPPAVPLEGQLAWSNTYGTLSLGLEGNHILHVGQETNFRVRNQTGSPLYKGQPVAATGAHNDNVRLRVAKYAADASLREVRFIGLISEDIPDNESGFTTNFGYVRGNNTSALDTRGYVESDIAVGDETWAQGDILYVHPTVAGKLTKVEPKHSISVAIVIRVHQEQGVLLVRPTSYGHLNDNHDVSVSEATNGQFLQYNSDTDYWTPSSSGNFTTLQVNGTAIPTGVGVINHIAYWDSANSLAADSGQLVWDSSNNRLGIGTTSPNEILEVSGNIRLSDKVGTTGNKIQFARGGGTANDYTIGKQGNHLAISTSADSSTQRYTEFGYYGGSPPSWFPKIRINNYTGDVGINNTSTPSGALDVGGDVYVRGAGNNLGTIYFKSQSVGDKSLYVGATNGGDLVMNGSGPNIQLSSQGGYLNVLGFSTQLHIGHGYDAGNTTQIIRFLPAAKEMMRMTASGTLGIGLPTSASSYAGNPVQLFSQQPYANTRVHIAGSGSDSNSAALIVTNSGIDPLLYVRNDGNVGIGTTTPEYKLQVNGSFGATTKSFRIDHPSKKGYSLEYGSLESPYHGVRLTGHGVMVKGSGMVSLPNYLKDLIHDDDTINIQITNIKHGKTIYVDEIDLNNDHFTVRVDRAKTLGDLEFFWTLTGVRKDVEDLIVEREK